MTTANNDEHLFAAILKGSAALLLLLSAVGFFLSWRHGLGTLAGGVIAMLNFVWMRNSLQQILGLLPASPGRYALIRFIGRMTVTGLLLYAVLTSGYCSLAGVLTGLSIIVINIIAFALYRALRTGG